MLFWQIMKKLQISLTSEEVKLLEIQASELGYKLTKFVKFLLSQEAYRVADQQRNGEKINLPLDER